jgi:hypothetical protein
MPVESAPKYRDRDWLLMSVCEEFVNKRCENPACVNAHCDPETTAMDTRKRKAIVCFENLKGTCTRSACHYYHATVEQKPQIIQRGRERQKIRKEAQDALQHQQPHVTSLLHNCGNPHSFSTPKHSRAGLSMQLTPLLETAFAQGQVPIFEQRQREMAMNYPMPSRQPLFSTPPLQYSPPSSTPATGHNNYPLPPLGYTFNPNLLENNLTQLLQPVATSITATSIPANSYYVGASNMGPAAAMGMQQAVAAGGSTSSTSNAAQLMATNSESLQLAANLLLSQGFLLANYNSPALFPSANYCFAPAAGVTSSAGYPMALPLSLPVPLSFPGSTASYPSLLNPFTNLQPAPVTQPRIPAYQLVQENSGSGAVMMGQAPCYGRQGLGLYPPSYINNGMLHNNNKKLLSPVCPPTVEGIPQPPQQSTINKPPGSTVCSPTSPLTVPCCLLPPTPVGPTHPTLV